MQSVQPSPPRNTPQSDSWPLFQTPIAKQIHDTIQLPSASTSYPIEAPQNGTSKSPYLLPDLTNRKIYKIDLPTRRSSPDKIQDPQKHTDILFFAPKPKTPVFIPNTQWADIKVVYGNITDAIERLWWVDKKDKWNKYKQRQVQWTFCIVAIHEMTTGKKNTTMTSNSCGWHSRDKREYWARRYVGSDLNSPERWNTTKKRMSTVRNPTKNTYQ